MKPARIRTSSRRDEYPLWKSSGGSGVLIVSSASPVGVVRGVIAAKPSREGGARIGLARLRDSAGTGRVDREFEKEAVRVLDVERAAIPVLQRERVGILEARRLDAPLDRLLGRLAHLERDVTEGSRLNPRAELPLILLVGELEERQRPTVREAEEAMAIRANLAEQLVGFAPRRDEGEPDHPLVEPAGLFHVPRGVGVVMETAWELRRSWHTCTSWP